MQERGGRKDMTNAISIWADGACSGNPGPGGFAAIVQYADMEQEICGGERSTTNNRMELTAVIEALYSLSEPSEVILYSDSQYVCNAINQFWLQNWVASNWKKSDGKSVSNVDLWKELLPLLEKHKVTFNWVKGHNNNEMNERCDKLACQQRDKYNSS